MMQRRILIGSLLALAAGASGALLWQLNEVPAAPRLDYVLLDGKRASSTEWKGKVMLVNFWATSCATCVKKMPMLVSTHQRYAAQGFDTLAVAMQYDPPAFVAEFAKSRRLPFGVAIDNQGHIAHAFDDVRLTPTTLLIDKQGRIHKRLVGDVPEAELHALIEQLLKA